MNTPPIALQLHPQGQPLHSAAQTRQLEAAMLQTAAPGALMAAAGLAVARLCLAVAPRARRVCVAVGPGNNGGDGLVAARHLHAQGLEVTAWLVSGRPPLGGDAHGALLAAQAAGVLLREGVPQAASAQAELGVDALLGLGQSRPVEGALAAAVQGLNELPCTVAVDLPTGLNADTGQTTGGAAVRARHSLSLLTLKPGLFTGQGRDHAGQVWLHRLGASPEAMPFNDWRLCGAQDAAAVQGARHHASHKGSYGDACIIGGAAGMAGAALLAAQAAQAARVGRVFVSLLDDTLPLWVPQHPEWMLRSQLWLKQPELMQAATVVCGCGGGAAVAQALLAVLRHAARLVLDADALNLLAGAHAQSERWQHALLTRAAKHQPTVLTPHPLEAARLLGTTTAQVQADRIGATLALAKKFQATVVLKGSGSVVADASGALRINPSGNARLAAAGSGDVLAGWMGGLWSAAMARTPGNVSALEVASAATWLHGLAAEPADGPALPASGLAERLASLSALPI